MVPGVPGRGLAPSAARGAERLPREVRGQALNTKSTPSTDTGSIPTSDPHKTLSEPASYVDFTNEIGVSIQQESSPLEQPYHLQLPPTHTQKRCLYTLHPKPWDMYLHPDLGKNICRFKLSIWAYGNCPGLSKCPLHTIMNISLRKREAAQMVPLCALWLLCGLCRYRGRDRDGASTSQRTPAASRSKESKT